MKKDKFKSGFVTIIGETNSGKSTLLNSIFGKEIVISNRKPSTTISNSKLILTKSNYQVVFIDTPGVLKAKSRLEDAINKNIVNSLKGIDILILVIEHWKFPVEKIEGFIKNKSREFKIFLVLNKIDLDQMETIDIKELEDRKIFDEIIEISALNSTNIDYLMDKIVDNLESGEKFYEDNKERIISDKDQIGEIVRESILNLLDDEIPYKINVKVTEIEEKQWVKVIYATINVEKGSLKKIIIGRNGNMIKNIGTEARQKIEGKFNKKVYLDLEVKNIK